ncbi:zinc transporter ZIP1-like [Physella acuta]|uniref:zinc transporter ZIP1-like n=1 Tax=Physella acuta TaxID=109671 RepID=UPI0027DCB35D|nr:zinc transporter ZIP1-like [Physella acuta]
METLFIKVITLVVLIFLTLVFSVLPYFLVLRGSNSLVSSRLRERVIGYLNCFAGGVFLATLLLHLLTEGNEEFENYKEKVSLKEDFPIFNTCVAVGFFIVAFMELFMHACLHSDASVQDLEVVVPEVNNVPSQYGAVGVSPQTDCNSASCREHCEDERRSLLNKNPESAVSSVTVNTAVRERRADGPAEYTPSGMRAFLLLVALSFHTIFDGLAVGLQKNESEVWQVFAAISIHKSIIAFCLGLEMFKSQQHRPCRAFLWLCFFSLMSPIGIGLGIALTSGGVNDEARLLSSSILQGLAAGTFLYVTFLEILCMYIGHNSRRHFLNIFFAMVGFVFMALVKLLDHD